MRTPVLLLILLSSSLHAQNFSNGFPFFLPPGDSAAQRFLPEFPAQPITGFVGVNADGHFESGGQPVRFWGVNFTFGANFPEKDKASFIAARMRKMGINLVRFHHMDNPWTDNNGSIFYQNISTTGLLNPQSVDRLHFLLSRMKANGVYANINLHVSRQFKSGDGVAGADSLADLGKAVTFFDEHLIALQKQYASQLLGSVNPYTGLSLANDPVMAMVEITNENTLYGYWKDGWLKHFSHDGNLMQRHVDTLDRKWNLFLQNKYASQTDLENAWNAGASGGGNEQLLNGGFESGGDNWQMELHDAAQAAITPDNNNPFNGNSSGRVDVTNVTGTDWHIQFKQVGGNLEAGKAYTLRFAARATIEGYVNAYAMRDNDPYNWYGGSWFWVTPDWDEYEFTFSADEYNAGNVRTAFSFLNQPGAFWFDNVSLTEANITGVEAGESLTASNFRRFDYDERFDFTPGRVADMADFYLTLQFDYFNRMRSFLKNELGVQVPITGSNAWGGVSDVFTAKDMDYIDDHTYWDHPQFPGGAWDSYDWFVENQPMVKSNGWTTIHNVFGGLAHVGKPYTVSEYRHTFPNRFEVEMMPWMAAYLSFHDADGVMFFEYNDSHENWEEDLVPGYFGIHRNTAQMALSPVYAYAYRQGLIAPAATVYEINYPLDYFRQLPFEDWQGRWGKFLPYDTRLALTESVKTVGYSGAGSPDLSQLPLPAGSVATTSTGETTVDFDKGLLTTATPKFASVCGFLNETGAAGGLEVLQGNDFGAVAWLSLDGEPLESGKESLLAVSSKVQNTGMVWDGTQTVHDQWGEAPTLMFPLNLTLRLNIDAASLRIFPLSTMGAEGTSTVLLPDSPGQFTLHLDQAAAKTTWFGLEALDFVETTGTVAGDFFSLSPNPATDAVTINLKTREFSKVRIDLLDNTGRQLLTLPEAGATGGFFQKTLDLKGFAPGLYFVKCAAGERVWVVKVLVVNNGR